MLTLRKAIVDMALDNGVINRQTTEDEVVERVMNVLRAKFSSDQLLEADRKLQSLTTEQLEIAVAGEETEMAALQLGNLTIHILEEAFNVL